MPKYLGDVRYWVNSGKHMLAWSFSGFDPKPTSGADFQASNGQLPTELRYAKAERYWSEAACNGFDSRLGSFECDLLSQRGVSYWQVIDWEQAKSAEFAFAFIKFDNRRGFSRRRGRWKSYGPARKEKRSR
jgi:hypothetical protein